MRPSPGRHHPRISHIRQWRLRFQRLWWLLRLICKQHPGDVSRFVWPLPIQSHEDMYERWRLTQDAQGVSEAFEAKAPTVPGAALLRVEEESVFRCENWTHQS
jgi:hypothetical protein